VTVRRRRIWTAVGRYADLVPGRGMAAVVEGAQIAVFRTAAGELYAVGNQDPISGAYVICDAATGARQGAPVITPPHCEHVYDLRSGTCLGDAAIALPTYPVRRYRGLVWVGR
jgi:nitrite reductase/ring-hydroxylating ferredoxin subunit